MSTQYDADPSRLDEHLDLEEARGLLHSDLKWLGKDTGRLYHLISRMVTTIEAYRRQIQQLHRDVQEANLSRSQVGTPSSLSPLDSVRYLTPEQFASAADQFTRNAIEAAERQRAEAKAAAADAIRLVHEVNLVVGGMAEDLSLPPDVRNRLHAVLTRFAPRAPGGSGLNDLFA